MSPFLPVVSHRLSPHFTLVELTHTQLRDADNEPSEEIFERLRTLALCFLEPVRARFGPLYVSSGYRSKRVNDWVGGHQKSAHLFGCAADLIPLAAGVTVDEIVAWVAAESGLPFDQVIAEYGTNPRGWVHLGMAPPWLIGPPRRQVLTMRGGKYTPHGG